MDDAGATIRRALAEVDNVVDELVTTIENGVTHADGSAGLEPDQAEELRVHIRQFAGAIMDLARDRERADLDPSIDRVVETIRSGVIQPGGGPGFGAGEADELRADLRMFADATVAAAREQSRAAVDRPIDEIVRTIRSGLFLVYGRASYAAVTADQLEAYLETFVDAVLTVVEKDAAAATGRTSSVA